MNTHPNEPLSPEERELAQLMARLGPIGEPSPALDAKVLAAAHSAAAREPMRKHKPRWPVAMGLAASVVFAVGIAWQLRPVQQVATVREAPMADAAMEAAPAPATVAPPPAEAVEQDAFSEPASPPMPVNAPPPPPPPGKALAPPQVARKPLPSPAAQTSPPIERAKARRSDGYTARLPPPPAAPPAPAPEAASVAASAPQAFASDRDAGVVAEAAATTEAATRSVRGTSARQSAASAEMKTANAAVAREQENTTLDRVEVTGSRLRTDLQVPVSDDAQLAVDDWLERVRTRYGLGDADAARRSLLLFVKDHPSESVPEDLEPLLDE